MTLKIGTAMLLVAVTGYGIMGEGSPVEMWQSRCLSKRLQRVRPLSNVREA